jgi:cell wall assembly regulator SMI1
VQKFTRPITREIELAGERLAVSFDEQGVSVRPVGGRSAPKEASWAKVFCFLMDAAKDPTPDEVTAAVAALKKPPRAKKADKPEEPAAAATPTPTPTPGGDLRALLERLEQWLAKHRPRFLASLRPAANEAELHQFEAQLGLPVPADLRTLLAWHNGQTDVPGGRFEENWLLMSTEAILAAKPDLDAGAVGNGKGSGWRPEWIPFLDDDSGDYLCLDTSQAGAPVRAFWLGKEEHPVVAPSLTAWVKDFVTAALAGRYHEDPERGTFLRSQS